MSFRRIIIERNERRLPSWAPLGIQVALRWGKRDQRPEAWQTVSKSEISGHASNSSRSSDHEPPSRKVRWHVYALKGGGSQLPRGSEHCVHVKNPMENVARYFDPRTQTSMCLNYKLQLYKYNLRKINIWLFRIIYMYIYIISLLYIIIYYIIKL